jgi:hypothetical protein
MRDMNFKILFSGCAVAPRSIISPAYPCLKHHLDSLYPQRRLPLNERMETMKKATLEKIFEYASMPLHGTLSRKLRKDISVQINEEKIYTAATLFLGEEFVRITETEKALAVNTYYDWEHITSVRTIAKLQE